MIKAAFFKGFIKHHYQHKELKEKITTGINMQNPIEFYPLIFLCIRGEWVFSFLFKDAMAHPHWKKKNHWSYIPSVAPVENAKGIFAIQSTQHTSSNVFKNYYNYRKYCLELLLCGFVLVSDKMLICLICNLYTNNTVFITNPVLSLILPNKERPVPEISVFALNV